MNLDDEAVVDRKVTCWHFRLEQRLVGLVGQPVPAVVGQGDHRYGAHGALPAGTAASLDEGRRVVGSFVLEYQANARVVETDFERGCRHRQIGLQIDTDVLGGRARYPQGMVASPRGEDMADLFHQVPRLAVAVTGLVMGAG